MNRSYSKIRHIQESNLKLEKRLLSEDLETESGEFSKVISSLRTFNQPKIINFQWEGKPMTTLNWGKMSERGKDKNWGFAIGSDGEQTFISTDPREAKVFEMTMGVKTEKPSGPVKNYSYNGSIDSATAVAKVKELINGLLNLA